MLEPRAKRPRYTRGLLWGDEEESFSPTARWSLTADPVPHVPEWEYENLAAVQTIKSHPHLFQENCAINIKKFQFLLSDHPNQPLVESVCHSLREGYWPWANTHHDTYPVTYDASDRPAQSDAHLQFINDQIMTEVKAGRYSEEFGPDLLPGMYSSPVHAVPKPGTDTFRLINDQSAGEFSLNSMISRDDVAGTCMDGIRSLCSSLLAFRKTYGPKVRLIMYKSDIKGAYRNLWLHPLWQIKQIVSLGERRWVDWCDCFGNRGSYIIWHSFASLVAWIAENPMKIKHLKTYIDDNASFARVGDATFYAPYNKYYPSDQAKLLSLWDELGIPHEERKQIYGEVIPFIGFDVDPNAMTISLSDERRELLLAKVRDFATSSKKSLKDFESLAGHINWSLPVWPLMKPCLSAIYAKIAGKSQSLATIRVNNAVRAELRWFLRHVESSNGIFLLNSIAWDPTISSPENTVCYTDACLTGLAFWFPERKLGFQCKIPHDTHRMPIFYYEAAAVTLAILNVQSRLRDRLVIYSDNQNTVDIWQSLKASCDYNDLLRLAIDELIAQSVDVRVLHVPGVKNPVADALSRFNNAEALRLVPGLSITEFQPPLTMLGAVEK